MTKHQIELVQKSWRYVSTNIITAGNIFYERLFEESPHLKPLFKGNMKEQENKLISMITFAVGKLHNIDEITRDVVALGARHNAYGVKEEHYHNVASALLWTLEKGLGDQWSAELKQAWTDLYTMLAGIMMQAPKK
jgi:hemoglobin-like flavoprotein